MNQDANPQPEAPIELLGGDLSWPLKFEQERALLAHGLARWLAGGIEHIGSTAVPGLVAKPVIDIMAPVHSLEASRDAIQAATSLGYVYYPYKPEAMHWFCKPSPAHRTHHLHLVPAGGTLWRQRIAFREALRARPALVAEYAELKIRLAAMHRFDREAYTQAKSPFVQRVLANHLPTPS
jgi:GrpB-like predicted nucleotidyltransferase (UPF0157 family)